MGYVTIAAYVADVWVLGTYFMLARYGREFEFHVANAFGCAPLIAIEVAVGAWPALVLTASFGLFGWVGMFRIARQRRKARRARWNMLDSFDSSVQQLLDHQDYRLANTQHADSCKAYEWGPCTCGNAEVDDGEQANH